MKSRILYSPMLGNFIGARTVSSQAAVVTIDDFLWARVNTNELKMLNSSDNSKSWDKIGDDFTPQLDMKSEGFWKIIKTELFNDAVLANNSSFTSQDSNVSYTVSNGIATVRLVGASTYLFQAFTTSPGSTYKVSCKLTKGSNPAVASVKIQIRDGNNGGAMSSNSNNVTNNEVAHYFTAVSNQSTVRIQANINGAATAISSENAGTFTFSNLECIEHNITTLSIG